MVFQNRERVFQYKFLIMIYPKCITSYVKIFKPMFHQIANPFAFGIPTFWFPESLAYPTRTLTDPTHELSRTQRKPMECTWCWLHEGYVCVGHVDFPMIEEVLYDLNRSTVFSKLDLKGGFHQIELEA